MADKVENIHENHRARVRSAYIERGDLSGMHDHQILELLLFYAIKRRDVNPLAHRLIDRFGSLENVLRAEINELKRAGLSENTAVLLKLVGDVGAAIDRRKTDGMVISNTNDALVACHRLLFREPTEVVALLCLDTKNRVVKIKTRSDCLNDKVGALPKWVVDAALSGNASAVILSHNHPSGSVAPSLQDREMTVMLENLLEPLGVALYDHVIVTRTACFSMKRDFLSEMADAAAGDDAAICGDSAGDEKLAK